MLQVGDRAPAFTAVTSTGEPIALAQFLGKRNVVLSFYPKDFTSGCTRQVCTYRDNIPRIEELDAVLFGISTDSDASHERFSLAYGLPFPLISDERRELSRLYGVVRFGGRIPLVKRVTYVIDKKGIIRLAAHHEFAIESHLKDVLRTLRELRTQDVTMR